MDDSFNCFTISEKNCKMKEVEHVYLVDDLERKLVFIDLAYP
jgi:hypothetical protein